MVVFLTGSGCDVPSKLLNWSQTGGLIWSSSAGDIPTDNVLWVGEWVYHSGSLDSRGLSFKDVGMNQAERSSWAALQEV